MLLLVGPYSFPGVLVRFPGQAVLGFPLTGRKGYKLVFHTKQGSKIDFKISKASCLGVPNQAELWTEFLSDKTMIFTLQMGKNYWLVFPLGCLFE